MAATRLIPLHLQKGRTMQQCLKERTEYAKNDEKTEAGAFVSAYECTPAFVDLEFNATKNEYEKHTGRQAKDKDVIAYMIRQSFKPGEITPKEANRVGYETAMHWTKGKHAFIVATHIDKAHIHNHIIYNSTSLDAEHKYKNFLFSAAALRRLSDMICLEHGLSVIDPKKPSEWQKRTTYLKREAFREQIRKTVDEILSQNPTDYEEFLKLLMDAGYEIKRGKYDAIKGAGQKSFLRFCSLGNGYSRADIEKRIRGEAVAISNDGTGKKMAAANNEPEQKMDLLLDIQEIISKGKGPGYEQWVKAFNIKQISKTLLFLSEQGIRDYEDLSKKVDETSLRFEEVNSRIKIIEQRMSEVAETKKHAINFAKAKDVYAEYKKSGYSKKFIEEHRDVLMLRKAAKEFMDQLEGPIPKVKDLNEGFTVLVQEKKSLYSEYKILKKEKQELVTAKYNVDHFLNQESEKGFISKKKNHDRSL